MNTMPMNTVVKLFVEILFGNSHGDIETNIFLNLGGRIEIMFLFFIINYL